MQSVPATNKISKIPNHYYMRKRTVMERDASPIALMHYHPPDQQIAGEALLQQGFGEFSQELGGPSKCIHS